MINAAVQFLGFLEVGFCRSFVGWLSTNPKLINTHTGSVVYTSSVLCTDRSFFLCILLHQFKVMITLCCKWICTMHLFECWCAWVDMAMTSVMRVRFGHVIFNIQHALVHMSLFECAWLTHEPNPGIFGMLAWGNYVSAFLHTSL